MTNDAYEWASLLAEGLDDFAARAECCGMFRGWPCIIAVVFWALGLAFALPIRAGNPAPTRSGGVVESGGQCERQRRHESGHAPRRCDVCRGSGRAGVPFRRHRRLCEHRRRARAPRVQFTIEGWFQPEDGNGVQVLVAKQYGAAYFNSFAVYTDSGSAQSPDFGRKPV